LSCGIVAGQIPAAIMLDGKRIIAFRDIKPPAPAQVLVIPRGGRPLTWPPGWPASRPAPCETPFIGDDPGASDSGMRGRMKGFIVHASPTGAPRALESSELTDTRSDSPGSTIRIVIPDGHSMVGLLGTRDELLHVIEREFSADIHVRGNEITVSGSPQETELIGRLFSELLELQSKGAELSPDSIERTVAMLRGDHGETDVRPADVLTQGILSARGRTIRPKTLNQKHYADAIDKHTIVFAIGPAGTGKTYLAMAKAVKALQAKEVNRIILTRPAVEAGERLGFLPGTLYEKIDPYLRPLYDALHDMVDPESIPKLTAAGTIEIAPLAFMRGRSLNDSFIILDEAQNTTPEQMKMFLTRLGFGSKIVVTGDVTQVDLPEGQVSGLRVVQDILEGIPDIHFARLTSTDVVRHKLVGKIVDAYERYDVTARQPGRDAIADQRRQHHRQSK
jgi:phosphate starvation-inducible PhoH-like protein